LIVAFNRDDQPQSKDPCTACSAITDSGNPHEKLT